MTLNKKMLDSEFLECSKVLYERVMRTFEDLDPDVVEADFHLDNITLLFKDGTRFIINRQPPTQQIWLATKDRGLHFDYDRAKQQWIALKTGEEFYTTLAKSASALAGQEIHIE